MTPENRTLGKIFKSTQEIKWTISVMPNQFYIRTKELQSKKSQSKESSMVGLPQIVQLEQSFPVSKMYAEQDRREEQLLPF